MYEWEIEADSNAIESRKYWLRAEIKRISQTTLRGNFDSAEDLKFWENRLKKLNGELNSLESR